MTPGAALAALALTGLVLAACSAAEPANYDPRDECRRCPPGLFSGSGGAARIELEREGAAPPSAPAAGDPG